jgi:hypothetical protein
MMRSDVQFVENYRETAKHPREGYYLLDAVGFVF